jgi:hypothetical protein
MYQGFIDEGQAIDKQNAAARAQNAAGDAKDAAAFQTMTDGFKKDLDAGAYTRSQEAKDHHDWWVNLQDEGLKLAQGPADRANNTMGMFQAIEKGADIGVDVLSKVTGPVGRTIKTGYTVTKDITKNMSDSYAKGEGLTKGALKGSAEAAFDVGFDRAKEKAINATSGKVPLFRDYKAVDKGGTTMGGLEKAFTTKVPIFDLKATTGDLGPAINTAMVRDGLRNGFKNATQGQVQKFLFKDPLKGKIGF